MRREQSRVHKPTTKVFLTFLSVIFCTTIMSCASIANAAPAPMVGPKAEHGIAERLYAATALVYSQDEMGGYSMTCTATAFEHDGDTYRFATAAHCVGHDNMFNGKAELYPRDYFITFDDPKHKHLLPAKVVALGYQTAGDDFAVLEVTIAKRAVPTIPIAKRPARMGEQVINVASPLGFGKQLFRGHVSLPKLLRPVKARGLNWKDTMLLQMGVDGGSSGSSIVSLDQEAIVGFLVGTIGFNSINIVAIPSEKFSKFWKASQDGDYAYFEAEEED